MHARTPKNFVLEEHLERYADFIEPAPQGYAGRWAEACCPIGGAVARAGGATHPGRFREVRLDLGCGKGAFTVEAARREPDVLFLGMDDEPLCMARAGGLAAERGLENVVFLAWDGHRVTEAFAPGELARIYLNFPTPFPRKRQARLRLTDAACLMAYRRILAPNGTLRLKTDSRPLYLFTLEELAAAGYKVLWTSGDAREDFPDDPASGYEDRLAANGAKVLALEATPGPAPLNFSPTPQRGLVEYLPQDLAELDYVPLGMEGTVRNMRNREARLWAKGRKGNGPADGAGKAS
ncbi:MAG: methyltransferase [Coriobacteriaceae bacterium]|nr:methyltransferase [Coriobacteriaceae bacterium]